MNIKLSPENFWKIYSAKLNMLGDLEAYKNNKLWTKPIIKIAEETCKEFGINISKEYYRIDLIGWKDKVPNMKYNWWLDIAYEHENENTWKSELCKLCYIAADLRIISSYYKFKKHEEKSEETIKKELKNYLNKLGEEKIFRIKDSKWLFVFGPRTGFLEFPFMAFTIDDKFNILSIKTGEEVIPQKWKID